MKRVVAAGACGVVVWLLIVLSSTSPRAQADASSSSTWNPRAAAAYLDQRQAWWSEWPSAARDHGTFCVSCHTAASYALARPALRRSLAEREPSPNEIRLLDNVTRRVRLWKDVEPFYPDQTVGLPKTSESRGTEAILNALILASRDAQTGTPSPTLSEDARRAFDNLWALQMKKGDQAGAWTWLNFRYEPWEADKSAYYGAALAALAVTTAPGGYAASPDIQDRLELLGEYLRRGKATERLFNRVMLLWVSATWPGLLTHDEQQAIIDAVLRVQGDDGGWSLSSLGTWKRLDGTQLETASDGYATGLIAFVLQLVGAPRTPPLTRGLTWLRTHQDASTGLWFAASLNKHRDPASDVGRFMSDAATAYAVLALTRAER
jgi:squalene-hopene/tetraprenyl-beta-curcumene cyclase